MIKATYALIGRLVYWLGSPVVFLISLRSRPRARVLVVDDRGRILLVRNWFGRQLWVIPGGGVRRQEPSVKAAVRELREELSLDLAPEALTFVGELEKYDRLMPFGIELFSAEVGNEASVHPHPFEVVDVTWVDPKKLPENLHPSVERALKLWHP